MDLDGEIIKLKRQYQELSDRVGPMLEEYEAHRARRSGGAAADRDVNTHHDVAREKLDNSDLEGAGKVLRLPRAHDGKEEDESYERRLRAAVDGAHEADAEKARPAGKIEEPQPADPPDHDPPQNETEMAQTQG